MYFHEPCELKSTSRSDPDSGSLDELVAKFSCDLFHCSVTEKIGQTLNCQTPPFRHNPCCAVFLQEHHGQIRNPDFL